MPQKQPLEFIIFILLTSKISDSYKYQKILVRKSVFIQNLKGSDIIIGTSVDFKVTRNIIIDGYIVIKMGAPAYGTVTSAEEARMVSHGGKIGLAVDYCKAIRWD